MPTYDYRCEKGHVFELFHGIKDESPKSCPRCGTSARRVPAAGGGLLFRGSGFYITDYRSKGYRDKAKAEGKGSGSSSAPATGGGDGGGKASGPGKGTSGD